jgi:hypothetical protein
MAKIKMDASAFRKELVKIMPGYTWTVHKSSAPETCQTATGIQSSGSNRLSTVFVTWRDHPTTIPWYEVKSSGFGTKSPWLAERGGKTLAQAFRSLQNYYENMARTYAGHARDLQGARTVAS